MEENSMGSPNYSLPSKEDVLIEYVKEKDSLKTEIVEKEKEIQRQKAKIYDLLEKVDELQKEVKNLQAAKQNSSSQQSSNGSNKLGVARPRTGRVRTPVRSTKSKSGKQKKRSGSKSSPSNSVQGTPDTKPKSDLDDQDDDSRKKLDHLQEVAKRYPDLKLSVIFEAEKFFSEGDINKDGTIDEEELEKLLTKQGHLFTNKELKDIMVQIDVDNNQSIDMMEYLAVMERVQQRKRVNLPTAITRSSACVIQ